MGTNTFSLGASLRIDSKTPLPLLQPGSNLKPKITGMQRVGQNQLPSVNTASIRFSDRSYGIDPNAPSNLDFADDPMLLSRGLLDLPLNCHPV